MTPDRPERSEDGAGSTSGAGAHETGSTPGTGADEAGRTGETAGTDWAESAAGAAGVPTDVHTSREHSVRGSKVVGGVTAGADYGVASYRDRSAKEAADSPEFRRQYGWLRSYYRHRPERYLDLQRWLNQGRFGQNYDRYLARTALYANLAALLGVLAALGITVVLQRAGVLGGLRNPLSFRGEVTSYIGANRTLFAGALIAVVTAAAFAASVWYVRYYYPKWVAARRRRNIDVTLPHAITFMYALSHGGMDLLEVMEVLGESQNTYGEVANEFQMVVREVDLFGNDVYTALQNTRNLTPSENMEQFLDDLLSVLDSGGDVTVFLEEETDTYLQEARDEQAGFIETLALLSEVFVVLFVAAPLFVIVLLIVMSLLGAETITEVTLLVYAILPLASISFLVLLDVLSEPFQQPEVTLDVAANTGETGLIRLGALVVGDLFRGAVESTAVAAGSAGPIAAGGRGSDSRRRARYDRRRRRRLLVASARRPVEALDREPLVSLFVTVPVALAAMWYAASERGYSVARGTFLDAPLEATVWLVVVPFLVVSVPLSVFVERRLRRERHVAGQFPDTLNALSSANRMGVQIADALELVAKWSTGPISRELRKVRNDIRWNHDPARALRSLADSLRVPRLSRSIALIAEGMRSSNDLTRVLKVAAEDTRNRFKIDQERRRELSSYVAVVIIGYLVYLLVIVLLTTAYLDRIADLPETTSTSGIGSPISVSNIPVATYELLFFHSAVIQAIGSGMLAGKLVENSALSGLKYSIGLVLLATITFAVI